MIAEEADIINIPGSPIEDRQYQLDLAELSVFTCTWSDIELNSQRVVTNRSIEDIVSLTIPHTFEWCSKTENPGPVFDVIGIPILDR